MTMQLPTVPSMTIPAHARALVLARRCAPLRRLVALCLGLLLLAGHATARPPWPDAAYSYYAENVALETLLAEFAASFSLSLSLQPGVSGVVNGRFTAASPTEFISRLGGVYGFAWYTHAGTLHVSSAGDIQMRSIPLPEGGSRLKPALIELGVVEPRFGWAELPDQRVVMVSGPASYIQLVESTLKRLPGSLSYQEMRVFRLKYASAEDRTITYRDQQVRQPGLATVLRQLVGGRAAVTSGVTLEQLNPGMPAPAAAVQVTDSGGGMGGGAGGGAGLSATRPLSAPAMATAPRALGSVPPSTLQVSADPSMRVPSIQSDPRLNALIIQDQPERMPIYAQLIAQLDVPSPLIEIEAMIVDVNSEQARELGINWSLQTGSFSVGFGVPGSLSGAGTLGFSSTSGGSGSSTLVTNAGTQLLAQLRLLENRGDARIQSRPSVLTIDNVSALLDLSETFYIRVQGERVASVTPVTAGTTLKVTPRLIEGQTASIQLTIDIEDGQIQDRQIDALPTVRRSSVSTQAIVGQDETLLIAGYASDQSLETDQKVPGLGDLPGIGVLFSNKVRTVQRRERLFMIKPKLVGLPGLAMVPAGMQR